MNIALFGGAFNPPHLGHKAVADGLLGQHIADEIWFVPVFKHPWADRYGKQQLAAYEDRCHMLELLIEADIGADHAKKIAHYKEVSFTYDTLEYFSKQHPEHTFSWVMGSEYLSRFDDFLLLHPRLLEYQFYVYPRAGYPLEATLQKPNMQFLSTLPEVAISSTQIKECIQQGKSIQALVGKTLEPVVLQEYRY